MSAAQNYYQKQSEAEALARLETRWTAAEAGMRSLSRWSFLLAEATLAASGFHKHGGEWRRPRSHGRTNEQRSEPG